MASNTEAMSERGKAMRAFTDSWRAVEGWNDWFLNGGIGKARGF